MRRLVRRLSEVMSRQAKRDSAKIMDTTSWMTVDEDKICDSYATASDYLEMTDGHPCQES